ncbi:MAG: diphosphomevalonate decarboxylase [Nanoarchaeota archaeon]|nr:diphosphomevalonate decarboxylase [Nanoarchaeota archaeon]
MKATAIANANIALIKYWGKRDADLMLPNNGSLSMTVDGLHTKTTVEFGDFEADTLTMNGESVEGKELDQVIKHLDLVRGMANINKKAKVASENSFPTAAGLASSASGFAALSVAAAKAAGLDLDEKQLSILSRRGSGSASRSVGAGFIEWLKGEQADGDDSYGKQVATPDHWPAFRMIVAITATGEKKIKSRAGMSQTIKTSPMYQGWLDTVPADLDVVRQGIRDKDFTKVGETAERNGLKMHATMITTIPTILYWNPTTIAIMHAIQDWRDEGLESYFTMDAGPQVKVFCLEKDVPELQKRLQEIPGVRETIIGKPGQAARLVEEHLF